MEDLIGYLDVIQSQLTFAADNPRQAQSSDGGIDQVKEVPRGARRAAYGAVTLVLYVHVEYGHFDEYMAWVTSTWVPTMEAAKKAGLIIGYKVFESSPKSPDQPNVYLEITYKNMAAYAGDIGDQADAFEAVTEKVICDRACQNQARVHRNEIRKVLGTEVTREIIFK